MPSVELNDVDAICSGNQLAAIIGVSPRQIDVLRLEGVLSCVRSKLRGRRYRLADSVQRVVAHQKQIVKAQCLSRNGSGDYEDARTRRMLAVAKREEMETKLRSGELINRESATIAATNAISIVRNHVLSIPTRCTRLLIGQTDPTKVRGILKAACVASLKEAVNFGLEMCEKESRNRQHNDEDTVAAA